MGHLLTSRLPFLTSRAAGRALLAGATLALVALGPTTAIGSAAAASVAAPVVTIPTTVDATGATDVTEALRTFFASVPDGEVAQLARGARYRVEGTLKLKNRNNFTVDGNHATIISTAKTSVLHGHIWIEGGTNLVVRRLVIRGANPLGGTDDDAYVRNLENAHGIRIAGAIGVEISNVTVTDVFGDFIYIGRSEDRVWSEDVWIHDSQFARNGRQGIAVTAARRVVIERNRLDNMRRSTIDLEPNTRSSGVEDVFVLDNTVGEGRLRFIASHGGGPVDRVVIARNTLRGQTMTVDVKPPDEDRRTSFYVINNTSDTSSGRAPLKFVRVDGLVVRGNIQPVRDRGVGIDLGGVCGVFIAGNRFSETGPPVEGLAKPDCGQALSPDLPPAPAIAGRTAGSPAPPATTTTTTTTTSPIRPGPTTAVPLGTGPTATGAATETPDSGPPWPWIFVIGAAAVAVVAVARSWVRAQRPASRSSKNDS